MKKILQAFSILALSLIFTSILWLGIKIPYNLNYEFGGEYLTKSYNDQKDAIKFIFFICLSILSFLFFCKKNYKQYLFKFYI